MESTVQQNQSQQQELFNNLSNEWWNPKGSFSLLHSMNPLRIEFIMNQIGSLRGLKILDIGCGGGILSEPLARLGAKVSGIDFSKEAILVAQQRSEAQNLDIKYQHVTPDWIHQKETENDYDLVIASEIIEHVDSPSQFIDQSLRFLKPDHNKGLILSTINRTISSYLGAILGAEYILQWVPRSTHSWKQFIKPSEIDTYLQMFNNQTNSNYNWNKISGLKLNPFSKQWSFTQDININYIGHITQK